MQQQTYLQVGQSGVQGDTPVDESIGSVEDSIFMQTTEGFDDGS